MTFLTAIKRIDLLDLYALSVSDGSSHFFGGSREWRQSTEVRNTLICRINKKLSNVVFRPRSSSLANAVADEIDGTRTGRYFTKH